MHVAFYKRGLCLQSFIEKFSLILKISVKTVLFHIISSNRIGLISVISTASHLNSLL